MSLDKFAPSSRLNHRFYPISELDVARWGTIALDVPRRRQHLHARQRFRARADAAAPPTRRCVNCGYDLRGLEQLRCPECGLAFDPKYLPPADIPWLKRGQRLRDVDAAAAAAAAGGNAFIAYWRTVWLILVRPRKFGAMVWQEVDVDAVETTRFRWITIGIAVGSVLATLLPAIAPLSIAVMLTLLLVSAPIVAFFWMATGRFDIIQFVAAFFAQEMRFRRLHDMSCAGLALAPIVPLFLLLGLIMGWPGSYIGPLRRSCSSGWWSSRGGTVRCATRSTADDAERAMRSCTRC